jgi:regulator of sigma E protease
MITAIIFIIVLSILIFVHEFGHFVTAKKAGLKVEEFGFGFPPKIFGIKRGETTYSINWIPFGGFVRILGEDGEDQTARSFASAKARVKAIVCIAGVVMNILFAVVLLSIGNAVGLRVGLVDSALIKQAKNVKIQIVDVAPKSPAELAGLRPLDEIAGFKVNGKVLAITDVQEVQDFISQNKGHEVTILIGSGKSVVEKKLTPRLNPPPSEGSVGISLAATGVVKYPWYNAIIRGVTDSANIIAYTVVGYATVIKNLFMSGKPGVQLSGPVGIAVVTGQAARLGFTYLMQFVALISLNLAVLNIIPFPALDGGRLLFVLLEKIKGKPISKKVENTINSIGFALLVLLMIYITTKDILKFF